MKYVVLEKAKPYTRVRRGKMERVKGYTSKESRFPTAALEEATVHQIAKDYVVSREEARRMYQNMFAEEKPVLHDPFSEHLEWERRMSGKFGSGDPLVVASRQPQVGDTVRWNRAEHKGIAQLPDRLLRVMQVQPSGGMIMARDVSGLDLMVHPSDIKVVKEKEEKYVIEEKPREPTAPVDIGSKLQNFQDMLEQHQEERFAKENPNLGSSGSTKVKIKWGDKYIKVDVGSGGKYMVERSTGDIYGIKGYGVIHRGKRYGNLDTIGDYYWGGYTAFKRGEATAKPVIRFPHKKKKTMGSMPGRIPGYSLG